MAISSKFGIFDSQSRKHSSNKSWHSYQYKQKPIIKRNWYPPEWNTQVWKVYRIEKDILWYLVILYDNANLFWSRLQPRTFANPAPLGLSAFAMTSFVLALINLRARDVTEPNLVVALAYSYGGLIQLLAGMWYVMLPLVLILRVLAISEQSN